jgi:hypothetical protein
VIEHPYGDNANEYYARGWRAPLPLPMMEKSPPPAGYTGAGGKWPSGADIWAWTEEQPAGNIALRMPPTIIGLDVDNYAGKEGAATLAKFVERCGALPPTWRSTSREDELSGIYLYRVPEGLFWPGELGAHVEIIQTRHRYAVAPPSVHPEGPTYRWFDPAGDVSAALPPPPSEIVLLPQAWVDELSGGRLAVDIAKQNVDYAGVGRWFESEQNAGRPCGKVRTIAGRAVDELSRNSSARHDIGVRAVMSLVYSSAEGHLGAAVGVATVQAAFLTAVTTGSSARDDDTARREWGRIIVGALSVLAADGAMTCTLEDPCANPLDGILMPHALPGSTLHAELSAYAGSASDTGRDGSAATIAAAPVMSETEQRERMREAIEAEALRIRIRREARTLVDQQDALRSFRKPRELFTLTDELAEPDEDVHFRIAELMPAGSNVLVTAMFKSGKTTLVNHVTRCLVDGLPVLGRYGCEPLDDDARVGIWNYEVSTSMYVRWLRDAGVRNTDRVSLLNLRGHSMPMSADVVRAYTVDWLVSHNVRVWVLDPFARAFLGSGDSENDNAQVGAFLEMIDDIKREAGVAELIMPTHTGRAEMGIGSERSRGATRLDDWADVRWLLVRDKDGTRYFRASGRDVETEEATLDFDPLTRNLTLVDGNRNDQADEQRDDDSRRSRVADQEVLNAIMFEIGEQPGCSLRTLRSAVAGRLHVRAIRVDDAVRRLAQQRLVIVQEVPNVGHRHFLKAQMSDD